MAGEGLKVEENKKSFKETCNFFGGKYYEYPKGKLLGCRIGDTDINYDVDINQVALLDRLGRFSIILRSPKISFGTAFEKPRVNPRFEVNIPPAIARINAYGDVKVEMDAKRCKLTEVV